MGFYERQIKTEIHFMTISDYSWPMATMKTPTLVWPLQRETYRIKRPKSSHTRTHDPTDLSVSFEPDPVKI